MRLSSLPGYAWGPGEPETSRVQEGFRVGPLYAYVNQKSSPTAIQIGRKNKL